MPNFSSLLEITRGTVTAPAGCGKTHLIAESLRNNPAKKPVLVLTHTNAGVASLRTKLNGLKVETSKYRLSTIDGWAIRLVSVFPMRSGIPSDALKLANPKRDYPLIRAAAAKLLAGKHIDDILQASYSHLIVDEYQDCSFYQHAIICGASRSLKTCVLGDPLQAIFNFGSDRLANWENEVCKYFPIQVELDRPWRWINAGCEPLGQWLLEVRNKLLRGERIDLVLAPPEVKWVRVYDNRDYEKLANASREKSPVKGGGVLIICESKNANSRYEIAKRVYGAEIVEAVDLRDLTNFAESFVLDSVSDGQAALSQLVIFAESLMTNVGARKLIKRVQSLLKKTARKKASDVEEAAIGFLNSPTFTHAIDLLKTINQQSGVKTYRPAILRACIKAMQLCVDYPDLTFSEAAIRIREQNRILGRPLPKRAVGSTLLLKGLEADVAVVLNADSLDAKNLYVAMTRGCRKLVICSKSEILRPR